MTHEPPRPREVASGIFQVGTGHGFTEVNVYLVRSAQGWVLVDTAWPKQAAAIRAAAESVFGPGTRPAAILLTHFHPDHSGAAPQLARLWQLPVWVGPDELPFAAGGYDPAYAHPLDRWVIAPLLRLVPRRRLEAWQQRDSLEGVAVAFDPNAGVPGLPGWECIPTPGHTPGHMSFFRPEDRVLITGDALVTVKLNSLTGPFIERPGLSGPPWYTTWHAEAAKHSIKRLAALRPLVVAGGHGNPITGAATATELDNFIGVTHRS
jgi:glyoxylase-like metal-dependent hydrolase (beta-lactamase superfamily II)